MRNNRLPLTTYLVVFIVLGVQCLSAQITIPLPAGLSGDDRNWAVNTHLDSLLNKSSITNGIVCITDNAITIDTVITGKVKRTNKDSVIVGKFLRKNQKKISSRDFWGVITSNGDCRRFYNNEMYLVWETPSPYLYRFEEKPGVSYYFSETLVSPLYSLDKNTIESTPLSPETRDLLFKALEERQRAEEIRIRENREMIADISLNILSVLLDIMVFASIDNHHHHHHHDSRPAQSTGPRNSRGSVRR